MIVEPQLDRDGTPADVRAAIDRARKAYVDHNASANLTLSEPWTTRGCRTARRTKSSAGWETRSDDRYSGRWGRMASCAGLVTPLL
jgi:hypothetical protein